MSRTVRADGERLAPAEGNQALSADLPRLGQLRPRDEIRFEQVDWDAARALAAGARTTADNLQTCLRPGALYGGVLIWNYPRWFSVGGAMIELMGSPFRYNKKERKRLRRSAKKAAIAADRFETEAIKPDAVPVLRLLAELDMSLAKSRKKKKSKNPN